MTGRKLIFCYAATFLYFCFLLLPHRFPDLILRPIYAVYVSTLVPVFFGSILIFIGCGLALPIAWLRGKSLKLLRSIFLFAVFSLISLVSILFINYRIGELPIGSYVQRFDGAGWREANINYDEISLRQKMLGDIVTNILPGRSQEEIENLLGPASEEDNGEEADLAYELGPERSLSWLARGQEWLLIFVDDSGRFEGYKIGH